MLLEIASFILSVVFGALVSAALLRAYLNFIAVPMSNPLGQFILAITDWLVRPMRRVFKPTGRIDMASLLAALLFSLAYAALLGLLLSGLSASPVGIVVFALMNLLRIALQTLIVLLIIYAVMSWMGQASPIYNVLERMFAPLLAPIRRIIPLLGGVDLSPLVLIVLLQIGLMVIARLG